MSHQPATQNPKLQVVQKAGYLVLVPFIAWLIFSIWAIAIFAFPRFEFEGTKSPPSISGLLAIGYFGAMTVWSVGDLLLKKKRNNPISIEQKSFLPFFAGNFLVGISQYLAFSNYLIFLGLALVDILPITIIIVLLQGKSFGLLRLYHRDIQIK